MSALDFTLPGSDPTQPNAFIQTPQQAAYLQQLGEQLSQQGTSTAPIQSPWQGAAGLAKALLGGMDTRAAFNAQNQGRMGANAALVQALGGAPGMQQPGGSGGTGAPPGLNPLAAALGAGAAVPPSAAPAGPSNNPGNLVDNSWTHTLPGYTGPSGRFASFDSPADGVAAMARNLSSYAGQGVTTLNALTAKWAPTGDGANNPQAYAATLAQGLGVDPNAPINLADPAFQAKLIPLMARVEQGPNAPPVSMGQPPAAGAPMPQAPPPSPAAIGQLSAAMQPPPSPSGGMGIISPAEAAPAQPQMDPRLAQASALNAPLPAGAPAAAPPAGLPNAGPPGAPPMPGGGASSAPMAPAAGAAPPPGAMPGHPSPAALMAVLSNPWASPAQQQVAMAMLQAQLPTPPTWGVIGKDVAGNEQYGWINPKTQTVTPAGPMATMQPGGPLSPSAGPAGAMPMPGAPPAAPGMVPPPSGANPNIAGATANGMTPQGAQWLTTMEGQGGAGAQVARAARAIINGQAPLPEANAATKPIDIAIRDAVFKAAPGFNSSVAAAKAKSVIDFSDTSSASSPGGLILNLNTALGHLGRLSDSSEKVGGFDTSIPGNDVANMARNAMTTGPAAAPLAAYRQDVQRFVEEATKFYQGSGGTEFDRDKAMEELDPSRSPSERRAAIAEMAQLMQTKATELQRKWGQAAPGAQPFPVIGPEAQTAAARIAGRAPGGAAPVTLNAANPDADYAALASGAKFIGPDGHVRVKP